MVGNFSWATTWAVMLPLVLWAAAGPPAAPISAEQTRQAARGIDVRFEPTPHAVVDAMLKLARIGPGDFLIDLGSGDGRIPIAAAKTYGISALGIDLDPRRIREARENARRRGVADKVSFVEGDLFGLDLSRATVVTLFLNARVNRKLRPRLLDLAPGTRIVSHEHDMGSWEPDSTRTRSGHKVFLWVVPAKVDGAWQLSLDGSDIDLMITQSYRRLRGSVSINGRQHPIRSGRLRGAQITLDLPPIDGGSSRRLRGEVTPAGDIRGEGWQARRKG